VTKQSAASAPVANASLVSTPTPLITGTPVFGETLTALPSVWDAGATLSYQWISGGTPVPGATGTTYTLGLDDVGRNIAVSVTGAKPGYNSVTRTSAATDVVDLASQGNNLSVNLSGLAKVGKKLTAEPGTFPASATITYQWFVGSDVVKSGPGDSLKVKKSMKGKKIKVVVNVVQPGYQMLTLVSEKTAKVTS